MSAYSCSLCCLAAAAISVYAHLAGDPPRLLQGLHTGLRPSHLILRSRQLSHANETLLRFLGRVGSTLDIASSCADELSITLLSSALRERRVKGADRKTLRGATSLFTGYIRASGGLAGSWRRGTEATRTAISTRKP